jgi:hypothetical protein
VDRWLGRIPLGYDSVGWLQSLSAEQLIGSQYTIPDDIILKLAGQDEQIPFLCAQAPECAGQGGARCYAERTLTYLARTYFYLRRIFSVNLSVRHQWNCRAVLLSESAEKHVGLQGIQPKRS